MTTVSVSPERLTKPAPQGRDASSDGSSPDAGWGQSAKCPGAAADAGVGIAAVLVVLSESLRAGVSRLHAMHTPMTTGAHAAALMTETWRCALLFATPRAVPTLGAEVA
jgi:hypothetical protein